MYDEREEEEGQSREGGQRVPEQDGEGVQARRQRGGRLRVKRAREGKRGEDGVGEAGGLKKGVVLEEAALD